MTVAARRCRGSTTATARDSPAPEKPWLPIPAAHRALAVSRQDADAASPLNAFRRFLRWRKTQAALVLGGIRFLDADEPVLMFTRTYADETLLIALNLGAGEVFVPAPSGLRLEQLDCPGPRNGRIEAANLVLPAHAVVYARVS